MGLFKVLRAVVIGFVLVMACNYAISAQVAIATSPDMTVVLTDEPCEKATKEQYPYKAQVREPKRAFETCYVGLPNGIVIIDYDELTDIAIPVRAFRPIKNI